MPSEPTPAAATTVYFVSNKLPLSVHHVSNIQLILSAEPLVDYFDSYSSLPTYERSVVNSNVITVELITLHSYPRKETCTKKRDMVC